MRKPALTDGWCTPRWLTDALGPFDLDPCSNPQSSVQAHTTYSLERGQNGLVLPWSGSVFCNPPYSDVMPWAARLSIHDGPWVALVKLDPTTRWWAQLMRANPIWAPFRKRIRFEGAPATANFPSVLVWNHTPNPLGPEYLWPEITNV